MIVTAAPKPVNFAPTLEEEIIQNVRTILLTFQGTVPYDRGFGLDPATIDEPIEVAQAILTGEIVESIATYEPRANVLQVTFEADHSTGRLQPIVKISFVEVGA